MTSEAARLLSHINNALVEHAIVSDQLDLHALGRVLYECVDLMRNVQQLGLPPGDADAEIRHLHELGVLLDSLQQRMTERRRELTKD